jgi:hypothetical protein
VSATSGPGAPSLTPSSSAAAADRLLHQLLCLFESSIMSIHKSKFVQFVVFFAASRHQGFARAVAEKLLSIAQAESENIRDRTAGTQRQCAAMYLASFLSRATFLPVEYVRYVNVAIVYIFCSPLLMVAFALFGFACVIVFTVRWCAS